VTWLKRNLYWLGLVLTGVLGFIGAVLVFRPTKPKPVDDANAAIDAGERARELELKKGRRAANAAADLEFKEALDALDVRQRRKADDLRRDPAARARFLARVSSRRPGDAI
jgi:hypothetical protein